jgi:hypothetical protein
MALQAIQIAFSPFVFTVVLRDWTVTWLYHSIDCHPALHVHFGTQLGQPLFRLIYSVTLERRDGKPDDERG